MNKLKQIILLVILAGSSFLQAEQTCKASSIIPGTPDSDFINIDNPDGTVTDDTTSLIWMRCSLGQSWDGSTCTGTASEMSWQAALQAAESTSFSGSSDWRLPNIKELASIVEKACSDPSINTNIFPVTPSDYFWSSSSNAASGNSAWRVNFLNGYDSTGVDSTGFKVNNGHVRLVRGGQ